MFPKVAVIGIGKLGLCWALNLERAGYAVTGVDRDERYVDLLRHREFRSTEPGVDAWLRAAKNFRATTDMESAVRENDLLFLVVATHSLPDGSYDHSEIEAVLARVRALGRTAQPKHLVVTSTTMPGYCEKIARELAPLGWRLSYNPEFIAQGTILRDQQNPDFVLIGAEHESDAAELASIHRQVCARAPSVRVMDRTSAEITKLALNCFLTTKIAFANFVGDLALAAGGDPRAILSAIGEDSRVGPRFLAHGYGFGGPCLPRDNRALARLAETLGFDAPIGRATEAANRHHLDFQVKYFVENTPAGSAVELGPVSYKPESPSIEASQQLEFAVRIARAGFRVTIRDSRAVLDRVRELHGDLFAGYSPLP